MAAPVFLPQAQPFRSTLTPQSTYPLPIGTMHSFDREVAKPVGTPFGASSSAMASVLIRRLPLNTSEESLRLMVVWSKELLHVEVLPAEQSEDVGFRSAILKFKTLVGAQEATRMLDGKSNISNDADMIVEILSGTPTGSRRFLGESASASSTTSSAASSAPTSRQPSRFNGAFQPLEKISPPMSGLYAGSELPNPESNTHYQNLFSPQSPIGNHLTERPRMSGKTLINNDGADDDDETGELLKDPVAYAENGAATAQRRATAPHIPISRLANLSLNTGGAPGGPASLPPFNHQSLNAMSHANAMSPSVMNGPGGMMGGYGMGNQHFQRHNFPPVNPADQNPPCNTLYVGNLPVDTSEEELKAMFSKQRGYKRLCFRTKQNGPMCFVEFEDISFATKALHELYGQCLHNSIKGGIRLSFSKNPLGVRSGPNPGQSSTPPMGSMKGMMAGPPNGFTSASGPPPGLSAPPGLGSSRMGYGGGGNGAMGGGSASNAYTVAGFPSSPANVWGGSLYNGAMAAGGPTSMVNNNNNNYLPPHMLGR